MMHDEDMMHEDDKPKGDGEEKLINVPLDGATRAALAVRARANGRAVSREAAMLIRRGLKEAAKRDPEGVVAGKS